MYKIHVAYVFQVQNNATQLDPIIKVKDCQVLILKTSHNSEAPVSASSETKTGVVRTLIIFKDRPKFSHIIQKVSARASH